MLSPFLGALLLGSVACSSGTDGRAFPSEDTATATTRTPAFELDETTVPSSRGSLASIDPCELVPESGKGELGLTGFGEAEKAPSSWGCSWQVKGSTIASSYTIAVIVYPKVGLDDVVGQDKQETTVGSHKAVRSLRSGGGGCSYAMEVAEKSRVEVLAVGGDGGQLCGPALQLAMAIEPQVP
ncbi:hypothetical protein BJP25_30245 [Actinokineospora bangkokensis]|uniref:DUF3558 domain-containing protein n=1 Tax=Actinokineospora bangkokensis TaxID=1193682 RepID=A0A1Q9LFM9_9PSEU|nr:hypothetical protein BJP25_30245 [Actinokineospora bangkokensis]